MAAKFDLNDTLPAAPAGRINVKWQADASGNVSAHVAAASGGGSTQVAHYFPCANATTSGATLGSGWSQPSTGGAALAASGTTYRIGYMTFGTGADVPAFFNGVLDPSYDPAGGLTVALYLHTQNVASGSARFAVDYAASGQGELVGPVDPTWVVFGEVMVPNAGTNNLAIGTIGPVTLAGATAGDHLKLRIRRLTSGDTLAISIFLLGIGLRFKRLAT